DRLARLATDLHDYCQWYEAICRRVEGGEQIGPEASALKVYITELTQRITEFNLELGEDFAAIAAPVTLGDTRTDLYWQYAMARPGTIYAGCNEVQRDILAKSVLGFRTDVRRWTSDAKTGQQAEAADTDPSNQGIATSVRLGAFASDVQRQTSDPKHHHTTGSEFIAITPPR